MDDPRLLTPPTETQPIFRLAIAPSSRGLLLGGTGTGKSTLLKQLMLMWIAVPGRRLLIIDSKPRWRATNRANGLSAKWIYRGWDHGDEFPNSILATNMDEFRYVWKAFPKFAVIAQSDEDMEFLAAAAAFVYNAAKRSKTKVLIAVDETMDHFSIGAAPLAKSGRIWQRLARSGRELGIAVLYASQRSKQIPISIIEEISYLFLFRIDYVEDIDRLRAMGIPKDLLPPRRDFIFNYWRKSIRSRIWGPFKVSHP